MNDPMKFAAVICALLMSPAARLKAQEQASPSYAEIINKRISAVFSRYAVQPDTITLKSFPLIVGGVPAKNSDNPFQVALVEKYVKDNAQAQFCGGTLLRPTIVVTAAHCSVGFSVDSLQVLTGARKLDGSGRRHNVRSIKIHESYDPSTLDYDVAVWMLADSSVSPTATLDTNEVSRGMSTLVTGWGRTKSGGMRSKDLLRISIPVVDTADCNDFNSYQGAITTRMLCAGLPGGQRDACQGDSGGPMSANGRLIGITSWGWGCGVRNFYGVYTRISNPSIRAFIEGVR
jgi:trypsin